MTATESVLSLRDERPGFVAGTLVVTSFFCLYPFIDWVLRGAGIATPFAFYDFGAYGGAVDRWLAGEGIYVPAEGGGYHGSFLYPPIVVLLFAPFALLPFEQATLLWSVGSLATLWVALQLAVSAYGVDLAWWERGLLLWLLLGFQPVL